jgi:serine/threonine-protein kinase
MSTPPIVSPQRLSQTMTSMVDINPGERVLAEQLQAALSPSFVLIRRLGAGGMGIVYLARDPMLKRLVAVKLMSPERAADPDARARFEREAEAVAAISHPNVVAVYSVGELPSGIPYLVMQYVEGQSMAERIESEGPLDLNTAKQILGHVASALDAAHRKGIVHRDIKAANILWDDASGRALVGDFGIAAIREAAYERGEGDSNPLRLTQTGMVVGTPRYMSPEQLLSEPVTEKTDIYSLGLLAYELLTGEGPYRVTSPHEIIAAHLRDAPRPISQLRPDADLELESLLTACLEKDPHSRPAAGDIARRLAHGSSTLLEWPPPGLEELHGAVQRPLSYLVNGSLAVALPLMIVAAAGRASPLRLDWPQVLVLPTVAALGALSVVFAAVMSAQLLLGAIRAARAGYGWTTIAEVLVDDRRDTGALITGEREYAALTLPQRNTMRRARVLQAGLRVGAGIWSIVGFFVVLPLASRGLGVPGLAFATLGVSAAMLVGSGLLARREKTALRQVRARATKAKGAFERLSQLARSWKESLDAIVGSEGFAHGIVGQIRRRAALILGTTILAGAAALGAYGLVLFSVLAEEAEQARYVTASFAQQRVARAQRLAFLRAPIDPTITPLRAGQALHSISRAGGDPAHAVFESPVAHPIPALASWDGASALFGSGPPYQMGAAIRQAAHGLSTAQRKFLMPFATSAGLEEFSVVAHARRIDFYGASLIRPIPRGVISSMIPRPRLQRVKSLAYNSGARAALALADGHPGRAEATLREEIGVGFALLEEPTVIENIFGAVIIEIGRDQLVAFYEATGRAAEARAISKAADPIANVSRGTGSRTMMPDEQSEYLQTIIRDTLSMRGLRWELAEVFLAYQPCSDFREVLFGPDSLHLARLAEARRLLVTSPGDNTLMELAERALENPVDLKAIGLELTPTLRSVEAFARSVDRLTGSKRMQVCALILGNL